MDSLSSSSYECDKDTVTAEWSIEEGVDPTKSCGQMTVQLVDATDTEKLEITTTKYLQPGPNSFTWEPVFTADNKYCPGDDYRLKFICNGGEAERDGPAVGAGARGGAPDPGRPGGARASCRADSLCVCRECLN